MLEITPCSTKILASILPVLSLLLRLILKSGFLPYTQSQELFLSSWIAKIASSSSFVATKSVISYFSLIYFLSAATKSRTVISWFGKCSLILVTRERTDLIPFDSILSLDTFNASARTVVSTSNIKQPWCIILPERTYCALPQNFLPSISKSLRPVNSALTPREANASITGWENDLKSNSSPLLPFEMIV